MKVSSAAFSVFGVPLLGLAGIIVCLWHPQVSRQAQAEAQEKTYLVSPDPRLNRSMSIFLRQEANNVSHSRRYDAPASQAKTVADYNLIAAECTPDVFEQTHLPPSL